MMRKLAVTLFALSLAALGCGSDSSSTPSGNKDSAVQEAGKADVVVVSDAPSSPDSSDVAIGPDTQVAPLDAVQSEANPVVLDGGKTDTQTVDVSPTPVIDGGKGVDAGTVLDTGTALDGGTAVDSGATG